jgi:hypothetical protein
VRAVDSESVGANFGVCVYDEDDGPIGCRKVVGLFTRTRTLKKGAPSFFLGGEVTDGEKLVSYDVSASRF